VNTPGIEEAQIQKSARFFLKMGKDSRQRFRIGQLFKGIGIEHKVQVGPAVPQKGIDHVPMIRHNALHRIDGG
jgi:hypothetical protein